MRILVTGHLGFIGSHVFRALKADGHDVEGCDWPDDLRTLHDFVGHAVVNLAAIGGAGRAARAPFSVVSNNACAAAALRSACERDRAQSEYPRVVHISSFSVYGGSKDYDLMPQELYGASKLMQELCWTGYAGPLAILRLSSVYGPGMRIDDPESTVIAKIAKAARDGDVFQVFEDGLQTRDWVHVNDVVDSVRAALTYPKPFNFDVCSGQSVTIIEACKRLGARYNITGHKRPGDMRDCKGDPSTMRHVIKRDPTAFTPDCILT